MKLLWGSAKGMTTDGPPAICGEKSGLVDSCVGEDALVKSQFVTALYTSKCCVVKPWKWNVELAR